MARRSSARLRGREASTPKRVSLSHDAPTRTPKTAPVKMSAISEGEEMPGAFPQSASPAARSTPARDVTRNASSRPLQGLETTPKNTTPLKASAEEMHPERHYQSTARPLDEARWLGFESMAPHTEPPKQTSNIATLQRTPTRASQNQDSVGSPKFQFSFKREQSLELSPEAKKLMNEKREEAAKIREQMIANSEGPQDIATVCGRTIATPKGKKGRFSEVHLEEFKKMDSIANHPSASRAPAKTAVTAATPMRVHTEGQRVFQQSTTYSTTKTLKRSPSKAELDDATSQPRSFLKLPSKLNLNQCQSNGSVLPPSATNRAGQASSEDDTSSPAKRIKRSDNVDASKDYTSMNSSKTMLTTPKAKKNIVISNISTLASPTQASLARTTSVKSVNHSQIPAPALARTPSKATLRNRAKQDASQPAPLLARSPSKATTLFSPNKLKKSADEPDRSESPLLLRSPFKGSVFKQHDEPKGQSAVEGGPGALLSRSPLKGSVAKRTAPESAKEITAPTTPLLARSPAKVPITTEDVEETSTRIPSNSTGTNLLSRFNLLRVSPMKSILRSPQRLYSDDPAKVAAGTHLATPPKYTGTKPKTNTSTLAMTAPVQKHVDFSSSTKDRYERAQSELSSTPSRGSTPTAKTESAAAPATVDPIAPYPSLPSLADDSTVTPQKRRQTVAPGDFTFRAGEHNIVFGQSPSAPPSSNGAQHSATIRHVSAEPQLPSGPIFPLASTTKKRKFEFENHQVADSQDNAMAENATHLKPPSGPVLVPASTTKKRKFDFESSQVACSDPMGATCDKENTAEAAEDRPAKRAKSSASGPSPSKQPTRQTTLGVKPKKGEEVRKEKKPSTISRARLNALAQPKRRA